MPQHLQTDTPSRTGRSPRAGGAEEKDTRDWLRPLRTDFVSMGAIMPTSSSGQWSCSAPAPVRQQSSVRAIT